LFFSFLDSKNTILFELATIVNSINEKAVIEYL